MNQSFLLTLSVKQLKLAAAIKGMIDRIEKQLNRASWRSFHVQRPPPSPKEAQNAPAECRRAGQNIRCDQNSVGQSQGEETPNSEGLNTKGGTDKEWGPMIGAFLNSVCIRG